MVLSVAISYATQIPIRCEARLLSRVQVRNCFKATMRPSHFKKTRRRCSAAEQGAERLPLQHLSKAPPADTRRVRAFVTEKA